MIGFLRNWILPIKKINAALPKSGLMYEVGSGMGGLAYSLAQYSKSRTIIGLDYDEDKIQYAQKNFRLQNLSYIQTDALQFSYSPSQGIVMSDFLHHLSYDDQEKLLFKLTPKVKKQGILVIKEIVKNDGIFMWLSRLWDFLLYPEDKIFYRTREEWASLIKPLGFEVKIQRVAHWFPGSTHLFICRKK